MGRRQLVWPSANSGAPQCNPPGGESAPRAAYIDQVVHVQVTRKGLLHFLACCATPIRFSVSSLPPSNPARNQTAQKSQPAIVLAYPRPCMLSKQRYGRAQGRRSRLPHHAPIARELQAAEATALEEVADRIGLELGLLGHGVLVVHLGVPRGTVAVLVSPVVIPPAPLVP